MMHLQIAAASLYTGGLKPAQKLNFLIYMTIDQVYDIESSQRPEFLFPMLIKPPFINSWIRHGLLTV